MSQGLCSGLVYGQSCVHGSDELCLQCSGSNSAASVMAPLAAVLSWCGMAVVTGGLAWHGCGHRCVLPVPDAPECRTLCKWRQEQTATRAVAGGPAGNGSEADAHGSILR